MRKINKSMGIILFIYALVLSVFLYIALTITINNTKEGNVAVMSGYDSVIQLNSDDITKMITENKIEFFKDNIQSSNYYTASYNSNLDDNIIKLVILFFIGLVISIFILWYLMSYLQKRQAKKVIVDLKKLSNENEGVYDEIYQDGYDAIHSKLLEDLDNYRKLNAYLSHEQKNILARMKVNADEEISEELDQMNNSIEDVLTLTETAGMDNLEEVDIVLEVAELVDNYSKIYPKISFDYEDEVVILSNSNWIKRALSNLIDNAIKYGDNNEIEVKIKNKYPSVVVEVIDNGIGIEDDELDRIFNHNYRINNLNTDGYGIGLSLVSHVCKLCNGFIYVDSKINKGTTFYLSFPLINIQ